MSWLVDTNVLPRLADEQSQEHSVAPKAGGPARRAAQRGAPAGVG